MNTGTRFLAGSTLLLCALIATTTAMATASATDSATAMATASATATATDLLQQFAGRWQSNSGPAATMVWSSALDDRFHRLDYQTSNIGSANPATPFAGVAYYQPGQNSAGIQGFWADTSGDLHPIAASREQQALVSLWGVPGGSQGRTRYELLGPDRMQVTDWILQGDAWRQFNQASFQRTPAGGTAKVTARVTGIGGLFFRAAEPAALAGWYQQHLGINQVPTDYDSQPWQQEAGPTVFAPFPATSSYFGDPGQQWMLNLRVTDLDLLVADLRARGIEVEVDPERYPNGRFARLADPEGNPIQLWQPEPGSD